MRIFRFIFSIILVSLLIGMIPGGNTRAAAPVLSAPVQVDQQVWADLAEAPGHRVRFIVSMRETPGGGAESAIPAQMALEQALAILQDVGSVNSAVAYYGANAIVVEGGPGAVRFLADWPGVAAIDPYRGGNPWEVEPAVAVQAASGHISGLVTGPNGTTPLPNIRVRIYWWTGSEWQLAGIVDTGFDGRYDIGGLATGYYRAMFIDLTGSYATEYYDNKSNFNLANNIYVTDGQTTANINASLAGAGNISGTVGGASGGKDILISAWFYDGGSWQSRGSAVSATNGSYTISGLGAGTYRVRFADAYDPPRYVAEYYNNVATIAEAKNISVTAGQTTSNINATLGSYGALTGKVLAPDGTTGLDNITVDLYQYNATSGSWDWVSYSETDSAGLYQVDGLVTRDYHVGFSDPLGQYVGEFYNDKASVEAADAVHVDLGATTANINASLAPKYAPPAPTGVSASDGTFTDRVQITWTASSGATYYQVYQNSSNSTDGGTLLGSPNTSPYNDMSATAGITFWYFIKACNISGCSEFSTSDYGYRAIAIPPAPTGVAATDGIYTDKVQVTWTVSNGASYYEVYRNGSNSTSGVTKLGSPSNSPYDDVSVTAGTTYWYFVKACNSAGCSGFSTSDSGYRAITAPAGVSASDGTYTDKVRVSWTASSGATYYQVYRNSSNSASGAFLLGSPATSPYDDASAIAGSTYWYFVKGCSTAGCSAFSTSDSGSRAIAVPARPTGVSASDGAFTDKVRINWTASSGATSYQVYRNSSNSSNGASLLGSPSASPYNDTSASADTTYWYFIKACNSAGCSAFSGSDSGYRATVVIVPSAPTGVSASDGIYTDKVQISWAASSGAAYYQVYWNASNSTTGASLLGSPVSSPYDDLSASVDTIYWYFVKACNSAGCSGFSTADSGFRVEITVYLPLVLR